MTTSSPAVQFARAALRAGLHPLPCTRDKKPTITRSDTGDRKPTETEIARWDVSYVGLICGQGDAPVLCIDFDQAGKFFPAYEARVSAERPELWRRLVLEVSPSGGYHLWMRTQRPFKSFDLAHEVIEVEGLGKYDTNGKPVDPANPPKKSYKAFEHGDRWIIIPVAIETRGATNRLSHFALCDPSPGYRLVRGDLLDMPLVDDGDVEYLLGLAREFEQYIPEPKNEKWQAKAQAEGGTRPGDLYNAQEDVADRVLELLIEHGWTEDHHDREGRIHLSRPGKSAGTSATLTTNGVFYNFSSNGHPFEEDQAYSPFRVYTMLEHDGDFSAAARALRGEGFSAEEAFAGIGGKGDKKPCQLALAREVIERIGADNVLHDGRSFWRWNDRGVWERVDDRVVKQVAHDVLAAHGRVSRSAVDSVTDIAKTECFSTAVLEPTQPFVNCKNGELHWTGRLWELRPHRKEHHAISQIPVVWEDWEADCPRFEQFLGEVFQPDEDAKEKKTLLLELMGYSLVPSAEYEKFAMLVGNGANGKSVVLHVLQALLGRENCAAVSPVQFNNRFQKAHLHGKLANLVTELPEGAVIADAELKAIVSGELITAEHKLQKPFDFRPTCTIWVATNHMPGTRDFSDALFRRSCVLKFNRTFSEEEQDKKLKDTLEQELPGILYSALTAYGYVLERGAFTMPPSVLEARQEWRLDADQVAAFLDDEVEQAPGEKAESQAVYDRYRQWADRAGISMRVGRKMFTQRLARFGFSPAKGTAGTRVIWGMKLKNTPEQWT